MKATPSRNEAALSLVPPSFQDRLAELILNPPEGSLMMTITPMMAEAMLAYNSDNRPISVSHVASLAREMLNGNWEHTGESIKFSDDGHLNDGQHRLRACISAGVPFATDVRFGIPRASFAVTDRGRKRTAGDIFAIYGVKNHNHMAAASMLVWRYDNGTLMSPSARPSSQELYDFYCDLGDLQGSISYGRAFYMAKIAPISIMTAMHFVCARKDRRSADDFFTRAATGVGIASQSDPAQRLRTRLIERLTAHSRMLDVSVGAFTIKAWNAYRSGRPLGVIRWRTEQTPNEPFPKAI